MNDFSLVACMLALLTANFVDSPGQPLDPKPRSPNGNIYQLDHFL
jgi:hypothetical protein